MPFQFGRQFVVVVCKLKPIHTGHIDVQKNNIGPQVVGVVGLGQVTQGSGAIFCYAHFIA